MTDDGTKTHHACVFVWDPPTPLHPPPRISLLRLASSWWRSADITVVLRAQPPRRAAHPAPSSARPDAPWRAPTSRVALPVRPLSSASSSSSSSSESRTEEVNALLVGERQRTDTPATTSRNLRFPPRPSLRSTPQVSRVDPRRNNRARSDTRQLPTPQKQRGAVVDIKVQLVFRAEEWREITQRAARSLRGGTLGWRRRSSSRSKVRQLPPPVLLSPCPPCPPCPLCARSSTCAVRA